MSNGKTFTVTEQLNSEECLWKEYSGDFNAMSDDEVEEEMQRAQELIDENQSWVDAVASWIKAGKPRKTERTGP